jgi:hypothetical protein
MDWDDPAMNEGKSPIKAVEEEPTQIHLELSLNLIEREFHDNKTPYQDRS